MELLAEIWEFISAVWSALLGVVDPYVNLRAFVPALVVLVVALIVLNLTSNIFLDILALLFAASSAFFLLLSINDVPETWALGISLVAMVVGLLYNYGDAKSRRTQALDVVLVIGFGLGAFYVFSSVVPGITLNNELAEALQRVGEFVGRASDAAQQGAEELNN